MPRIAASVIEEIRRLGIADVIGAHVELFRKGRSVTALCPFHSEKTPSFHVNEDKNFFKCFGCNEAGDSITFIKKYKNLDYADAVTYLCENFGIELVYDASDAPAKPIGDLKAIHEYVSELSVQALFAPEGEAALSYLLKRGFSEELIKSFGLGWLGERLPFHDIEKRFGAQIMKESGIFINTRLGHRCFFENRIIFPIRSATGACVGFSGRSMNPEEKAKYKNSPETSLFSKRRELYNLHNAKDAMKQSGICYIVEGYFDAMRMCEAGYEETVAIMGTAFTDRQVAQLVRYVEEFRLLLDGDAAGQKAMRESANVALEAGIYPYIIFLPDGEDPDTFMRQYGKAAFETLAEDKKDLFIYIMESERAKAGDDDNRRFIRMESVKRMLGRMKDPYRREHYATAAAEIFAVSKDTLFAELTTAQPKTTVTKNRIMQASSLTEAEFLGLLMQLPEESADGLVSNINEDYFEDTRARTLYKKMVDFSFQYDSMRILVDDPEVGEFVGNLMIANTDEKDIYAAAYKRKNKILLNYYENRQRLLIEEQKRASTQEDKLCIFKELQENIKRISSLRGE